MVKKERGKRGRAEEGKGIKQRTREKELGLSSVWVPGGAPTSCSVSALGGWGKTADFSSMRILQ